MFFINTTTTKINNHYHYVHIPVPLLLIYNICSSSLSGLVFARAYASNSNPEKSEHRILHISAPPLKRSITNILTESSMQKFLLEIIKVIILLPFVLPALILGCLLREIVRAFKVGYK